MKKEVLRCCRKPVPTTPVDVVRHLKKRFPSFYPGTPSRKAVYQVRTHILHPLEKDGLLVAYRRKDQVWEKAVGLVRVYSRKNKKKTPRKLQEVYQTNFAYLEDNQTIIKLPTPDKETNLDLVVFLSRFEKPKNYFWKVLNLLLCCKDTKQRDRLRVFIYTLPLDYQGVNILEKVLEYGEEYKKFDVPLQPNLDEAKKFLEELSGQT
jgi:hypothetical protein